MADIQVVIMAGGIGSRLWPLSTPDLPKQFVDVLGVGKTLIQMTVDRFLPVCPIENIWIVTSEHYESIVRSSFLPYLLKISFWSPSEGTPRLVSLTLVVR